MNGWEDFPSTDIVGETLILVGYRRGGSTAAQLEGNNVYESMASIRIWHGNEYVFVSPMNFSVDEFNH